MIEYDEKAARATERSYLEPEIVRQRIGTLDALALRTGERVLDVGCGPGLLAHDMALQVGVDGRVVGVDKSEAMLKLARQRCAHLSQVELKQGLAESLSAEDQTFHTLACTQVLLYIPELGPLLRGEGFTAIHVEAIPVLDTSCSPNSFAVALAKSAQERGVVSEAQARSWLDDLERLGRERAYFFCVNRFLFSAVRA